MATAINVTTSVRAYPTKRHLRTLLRIFINQGEVLRLPSPSRVEQVNYAPAPYEGISLA